MPYRDEAAKCLPHTLSERLPAHTNSPHEDPSEQNLSKLGRPEQCNASTGHAPERVKTRLLRRHLAIKPAQAELVGSQLNIGLCEDPKPAGSLQVIEGPMRGDFFEFFDGFSRIGRGSSQDIQLADDNSVSRENHALIGYVRECRRFAIFDGGKVNPVWVNDKLVVDAIYLETGDIVRIGETALRFMAL